MLENLRAVKVKHAALCSQVKEITAAQKESMDCIRNSLSGVLEVMQHFQLTTDVEVPTQTDIFFYDHIKCIIKQYETVLTTLSVVKLYWQWQVWQVDFHLVNTSTLITLKLYLHSFPTWNYFSAI